MRVNLMETIKDVMTRNPSCCTPQDTVQTAARIMATHDCGIVPVVESQDNRALVGVITDRDIVVRSVASGRNPADARVGECISRNAHTLTPDDSLEECRKLMEQWQVRRVPIVDAQNRLLGIVAMADLADELEKGQLGEALAEVSEKDQRQLYGEMHEDKEMDEPVEPAAEFSTGGR